MSLNDEQNDVNFVCIQFSFWNYLLYHIILSDICVWDILVSHVYMYVKLGIIF